MAGSEPLPRYRHVAETVGSRLQVVQGGRTRDFCKQERERLALVVDIFNPYLEIWEQRRVGGDAPAPGTYGAASASANGALYTFGGVDATGNETNALHKLDTAAWRWHQLSPRGGADGAPLPKFGCGMVAFGEVRRRLAVVAGHALPPRRSCRKWGKSAETTAGSGVFLKNPDQADGSGWTNEFHIYDLADGVWSCPATTGERPPPCSHFSLTAVSQRCAVMFGGYNKKQSFLNDVYIIDLQIEHWTKVKKHDGAPWPAERSAHAACCLNYGTQSPQLVVTGGTNEQSMPFTDLWILDVRWGIWRMIVMSEPLKPRWGHTVSAINLGPQLTELTLFGGTALPWKGSEEGQPKLADTTLLQLGVVESGSHSHWELLSVAVKRGSSERVFNKMRFAIEHTLPAMEEALRAAVANTQQLALQQNHVCVSEAKQVKAERELKIELKPTMEVALRAAVPNTQQLPLQQNNTEAKQLKAERQRVEELKIELKKIETENIKMAETVHALEKEKEGAESEIRDLKAHNHSVTKERRTREVERMFASFERDQALREADAEKNRAIYLTEKMQQREERERTRSQDSMKSDILEKFENHRTTEELYTAKHRLEIELDKLRQDVERLRNDKENAEVDREREHLEKLQAVEERNMAQFEKNEALKLVEWAKRLEIERNGEAIERQKAQEERDRAMIVAQTLQVERNAVANEAQKSQKERDIAKGLVQKAEEERTAAVIDKLQAESDLERVVLSKMEADQVKEKAIFELRNAVSERDMERSMREMAETDRDRLQSLNLELEKKLLRVTAEKELAEQEKMMALAWKRQAEEERDGVIVAKKLAESERDRAEMERQRAVSECRRLTLEKHLSECERCHALEKQVERDSEYDALMNEKHCLEEERDRARDGEVKAREETQSALKELQEMIREKSVMAEEMSTALQEVESLKDEKERVVQEVERIEEERGDAVRRQVETEHTLRELQAEVDELRTREHNRSIVRQQALSADLRGPSWEVKEDEIEISEETLGVGGWAEVKVAKLKVAAKVLHQQLVYDYHIEAFKREMDVAARVSHPNLLRFLGARLEGGMAILTEFMPTSLRALVNSYREVGSLPTNHLLSIAVDVACALNYLHNMTPDPIIHRDLSSANVLLQTTAMGGWLAKLSDYGTANFKSQLRTQNPGNPVYTAPEASDPAQQSPKMDIFSFGVLLLEMCTCEFPSPEVRSAQMESVGDARFEVFIRECVNEDPDLRPTAASLVTRLQS